MKHLLYIIIIGILTSCAQQSGLSGGLRDTVGPIADETRTIPKNKSINFTSTKIEIGFNEFIRLDKPNQNIIITPSIANKPTYEVKGKKVIIDINNELDKNTTYIINFGSSISDITEGNKIESFNYVFSTGDKIDSLTLNGFVYDAFSKETQKEILVGLYQSNADSTAITDKPYYFSPTKPDGSFAFRNLKEGTYNLLAIEDNNGNLKYDPYSDKIAFIDSSIVIQYDTLDNPIILSLFEEEKQENRIKEKKYDYPGKVTLKLEKESIETKIRMMNNKFSNDSSEMIYKYSDSISFWVKDIDSLTELKMIIEIENQEVDTVFLKTRTPKQFNDTILIAKPNTINNLPYFESLNLTFKTPLKRINSELISLIDEDSIKIDFSTSKTNNIAIITSKFEEDLSYQATILPGGLEDIYNRKNDTINLFFNTIPPNQYGNLILHYKKRNNESQHIIQLIQEGKIINQTIISELEQTLEYKNLNPGNYQLKTIEDNNNNGKWDTGDYLLKRQAELVKLFEDKIDLKGGWDLDLTWKN